MKLLYLPFILQGLIMLVDEFWAHQKRTLPKWERIGHPLDSLTTLICFLYLAIWPYQESRMTGFIALAIFSCLFITKDEFVHTTACSGAEHWLHSMLFILHPITFFCAAIMWKEGGDILLIIQPIIVGLFMLYQILRWSIPWQQPAK